MPIGIATHIAINAIKNVPANSGTEPNASLYISGSTSAVASRTKVLAGYQCVPKIKSKKGITLKNLIVSKIKEKTIPSVVNIAAKDDVNKTAFKNFSTGSLVLVLFDI